MNSRRNRIPRRFSVLALALALGSVPFSIVSSDSNSLDELGEVVVVGRLPGPPLWKISKGEHVLWILPLIDAYPKKMEWESARVEALIAQSQEYIERPRWRAARTLFPCSTLTISWTKAAWSHSCRQKATWWRSLPSRQIALRCMRVDQMVRRAVIPSIRR
jgi:hypothetical protein